MATSEPRQRLDWVTLLCEETKLKAGKALVDFAMCAAARTKLDPQLVKKIVTTWLNNLNLAPDDSTLDIEVEKFVYQDEHSLLSYVIGHRLIVKVNEHFAFHQSFVEVDRFLNYTSVTKWEKKPFLS